MKKGSAPASLLFLGLIFLLLHPGPAHAQSAEPVVRAVLFYSPTCPHCHVVLNETLPPLYRRYGEQLQIVTIDIAQPQGDALFMAALEKFGMRAGGVPFLVVGDRYLFGSVQIPDEFPGLIEFHLAQGGIGWPDIPGLSAVLPQSPGEGEIPVTPVSSGWRAAFSRDPLGNSFSVIVLVGMLAAVPWAGTRFRQTRKVSKRVWTRAIPILSILGLAVAGYLSYVEAAQVTAICGPVGDCNTVQQSEYARLFGIIPIGVLGAAGYVAILAAWLMARYSNDRIADIAGLGVLFMTAFGTLFSIYLTFLEPFVIGATCAWCLTSAVLMTILMLLSVRPARAALSRLTQRRSHRRGYKRAGVHRA